MYPLQRIANNPNYPNKEPTAFPLFTLIYISFGQLVLYRSGSERGISVGCPRSPNLEYKFGREPRCLSDNRHGCQHKLSDNIRLEFTNNDRPIFT